MRFLYTVNVCDCVDRLPMSDSTPFSSDDDKCSADRTSLPQAKPASDAVVCHQNKPSPEFVVPLKHKGVNGRNEDLMHNVHRTHVNVPRPVVMRTLSQTQSLSDKCSSNLKFPDLQCIYESNTGELLCSSPQEQNFVVKSSEHILVSQFREKESHFVDTGNDCIVKNVTLETLSTVSAKDVLHAPQQQQTLPDAAVSNNEAVIAHSSDVDRHPSLSHLSEKVDTLKQPSGLSFTNDNVRSYRLICKDSQLERIVEKSKLMSLKPNPGSLLMSRNSGSRLSLKDAVGGIRPSTYSLLEVAFSILLTINY